MSHLTPWEKLQQAKDELRTALPILGTRSAHAFVTVALQLIEEATAPIARNANDGPYRPELAEAFREGARQISLRLSAIDQSAEIDVIEGTTVEEGEGGAWVHVRLFVGDEDRPWMNGEAPRIVACEDCDWTGAEADCDEVRDIGERVDAGETMPAGECPECGALCHLRQNQEA